MAKVFSEFNYNDSNVGIIEVITGPMFSGKTEELIQRLTHHESNGEKVICLKPAIDDRYHKTDIISHDNSRFKALAIDMVNDIIDLSNDVHVIGIDEAQFFHESIVDIVSSLANSGKRVIISGLNLDYKGAPFTTIAHLMAKAESVLIKQGKCEACGDHSTHTYRKPLITSARIAIGGSELYEPRCRKCFLEGTRQ